MLSFEAFKLFFRLTSVELRTIRFPASTDYPLSPQLQSFDLWSKSKILLQLLRSTLTFIRDDFRKYRPVFGWFSIFHLDESGSNWFYASNHWCSASVLTYWLQDSEMESISSGFDSPLYHYPCPVVLGKLFYFSEPQIHTLSNVVRKT